MSLVLYHSGLSTCSKQVRLALREKGLAYESRYIELWRYENLHPDYLKLNPNGVVPTLVHDGQAIYNALTINEYLDDVFPDPPLRPADPAARWNMRQWTWTADMLHLAVQDMTYAAVLQSKVDDLTDADKEKLVAAIPVPDRRARWRHTVEGGFSEKELAEREEMFAWGIAKAEAQLAETPWLAGDDFSLADISMITIVHRIGEIRPALVDPATVPQVAAWQCRVKDRPAARFVFDPNTDEVRSRPAGKSLAGLETFPYEL